MNQLDKKMKEEDDKILNRRKKVMVIQKMKMFLEKSLKFRHF